MAPKTEVNIPMDFVSDLLYLDKEDSAIVIGTLMLMCAESHGEDTMVFTQRVSEYLEHESARIDEEVDEAMKNV